MDLREVNHQIVNGFGVDLHASQVHLGSFKQVLCQYSHSGADLQRRQGLSFRYGQCLRNPLSDGQICQKMLAKGLLCSYFHSPKFITDDKDKKINKKG